MRLLNSSYLRLRDLRLMTDHCGLSFETSPLCIELGNVRELEPFLNALILYSLELIIQPRNDRNVIHCLIMVSDHVELSNIYIESVVIPRLLDIVVSGSINQVLLAWPWTVNLFVMSPS